MKKFRIKNLLNTCSISLLALTLAACGSSDSNSDETVETDPDTNTIIDATSQSDWVSFDLSTDEVVTDDTWQVQFRRYALQANGGSSGDGEVTVCVAHTYDDMYDEHGEAIQNVFESYSADNTLADFTAIDSSYCHDDDYQEDTLEAQITQDEWLDTTTYSVSTELTNGWIIQSSTEDNYSRVKVSEYNYDNTEEELSIVLQSELWDGSEFGDVTDSPSLSVSADEKTYWDLETNTVVTDSDDWDLSITLSDDYDTVIQINSGASGDGNAAVAHIYAQDDDEFTISDPTAWDVDNIALYPDGGDIYSWNEDSYTSVFDGPSSYGSFEYNVDGNNTLLPNYTTYLVKDGNAYYKTYYKIQVLSYYGEDGTESSGTLWVRHSVTE